MSGATEEEEDQSMLLKWLDHKQVFTRVMSTLREKELFADVMLYCGTKRYAAHKFVLSTCSPYLEGMLGEVGVCGGEVVALVLADTPPSAVEALLDFLYLGQVEMDPASLNPLLDLAHDLRVRGLITPSHDPLVKDVREAKKWEQEQEKKEEEKKKEVVTVKYKNVNIKEKEKEKPKKKCKKKSLEHDSSRESKSSSPKKTKDHKTSRTKHKSDSQKKVDKHISKKHETKRSHKSKGNDRKSHSRKESSSMEGKMDKHDKNNAKIEKEEKPSLLSKKMKCNHCEDTFRTVAERDLHQSSHTEKDLLSCPECPFRTLDRTVMNQHINNHIRKVYECPYCMARHSLEKLHIVHQRTMHVNKPVIIRMLVPPHIPPLVATKRKKPPEEYQVPKKFRGQSPTPILKSEVSPCPSPTHKVLNSPSSSPVPSPASTDLQQFSITSPSSSPFPTYSSPYPGVSPSASPMPPPTSMSSSSSPSASTLTTSQSVPPVPTSVSTASESSHHPCPSPVTSPNLSHNHTATPNDVQESNENPTSLPEPTSPDPSPFASPTVKRKRGRPKKIDSPEIPLKKKSSSRSHARSSSWRSRRPKLNSSSADSAEECSRDNTSAQLTSPVESSDASSLSPSHLPSHPPSPSPTTPSPQKVGKRGSRSAQPGKSLLKCTWEK